MIWVCMHCVSFNRPTLAFCFSAVIGDNLATVDLDDTFVPIEVRTSGSSTCALSDDGRVKCWGWNNYGQLGLGHTTDLGQVASEMGDNLQPVDLGDAFVPASLSESTLSNSICALSINFGLYFYSVVF